MVVRDCVWPRSSSVLCMGTSVLELKNNAPSSASVADEITLRMIVYRFRMAPLFGGFYLLLDRRLWPPAQLCELFLER